MLTAHIPDWAVTSLIAVVVVGIVLFTIAVMGARNDHYAGLEEGLGAVRKVVRLARYGLGVMRRPAAAALALLFQLLGWTCQLFAVYTAMRAFGIHEPLPAAGLVLVLMNVATIFPLWPGNVGLVQAAVALPLFTYYGVAKANGIAFGFGLQIIEASVGIGVGLLFLAREGLSVAMLRVMPDVAQADTPARDQARAEALAESDAETRARSPVRLASKASCRRARRPPRWRRDCARGPRSTSSPSPTAGRERSTCCMRRSVASGARRRCPTRSGGRALRAGSSAAERHGIARGCGGDPARSASGSIRSPLRVAGSASSSVRSGSRASCTSVSAERRMSTAAPACSRCSTSCPRRHVLRATSTFHSWMRRESSPRRRARPQTQAVELEARLLAMGELAPYADLPGAGAAGGLGAALASLGAELLARRAARARPDRIRPGRLRPRGHGRGNRRSHDDPRESTRRGRPTLRGGGSTLRRVRRPHRRGASGARSDCPVR